MSRRSPRSQLQALRRGKIAKDHNKDREKWLNGLVTRREVDEMIRFYLGQYVEAIGAAEVAVEAELPVEAPDADV